MLVSYCAYVPYSMSHVEQRIYETNIAFFWAQAVLQPTPSVNVTYVFSLVGNTSSSVVPSTTTPPENANTRVFVRRSPVSGDLMVHSEMLSQFAPGWDADQIDQEFSHFVFMNNGIRGPFLAPERRMATPQLDGHISTPYAGWLNSFMAKFEKGPDVHVVGPYISCETGNVHVQSFMVMVDTLGFGVIATTWGKLEAGTTRRRTNAVAEHRRIIAVAEVGLSTQALSQGLNIASLESRWEGVDFRKKSSYGKKCKDNPRNPTMCVAEIDRAFKTGGCSMKITEVAFVKYGGEVLRRQGLIAGNILDQADSITFEVLGYATPRFPDRQQLPSVGFLLGTFCPRVMGKQFCIRAHCLVYKCFPDLVTDLDAHFNRTFRAVGRGAGRDMSTTA